MESPRREEVTESALPLSRQQRLIGVDQNLANAERRGQLKWSLGAVGEHLPEKCHFPGVKGVQRNRSYQVAGRLFLQESASDGCGAAGIHIFQPVNFKMRYSSSIDPSLVKPVQ